MAASSSSDDPLSGYRPPAPISPSPDEDAVQVTTEFTLLSREEVKALERKRMRVMLPTVFFSLLPPFVGLGLGSRFRDELAKFANAAFGETLGGFLVISPLFVVVAGTVLLLVWAEKRAQSYALLCPGCSQDLTTRQNQVLRTRRCSRCDQQIIRGRKSYSDQAYKRFSRIKQKKLALRWLCVFPGLSNAALLGYWISPVSFDGNGIFVVIPALIGTVGGGWALLRSRDLRFLPCCLVSAALFFYGALKVWGEILGLSPW